MVCGHRRRKTASLMEESQKTRMETDGERSGDPWLMIPPSQHHQERRDKTFLISNSTSYLLGFLMSTEIRVGAFDCRRLSQSEGSS